MPFSLSTCSTLPAWSTLTRKDGDFVQGNNFVLQNNPSAMLVGNTTVPAGTQVLAFMPAQAQAACSATAPGGSGVSPNFSNNPAIAIDRLFVDFALTSPPPGPGTNLLAFGDSVGGFARNGALYIVFAGTTAVNVDLTNLGASVGVTSSQAGDTSLATIFALKWKNISPSASTITMTLGASNPSRFPSSWGPLRELRSLQGDIFFNYSAVGQVVDASHKIITFSPTAGGAILLAYGGA